MGIPNRKENIGYPILFVLIIWLIRIVESILNQDWGVWGIYPRTLNGAKGILFAPLLHQNFQHLMYNTIPLLVLGILLFHFYRRIAFAVFLSIYFISDILIWLTARSYYHIGASILVYGFIGFLVSSGIFRKELKAIVISILVLLFYGGAFLGIFPTDSATSWEGHLIGFLVGIGIAYIFRNENSKNT